MTERHQPGFDQESWEQRYRERPALWSDRANPQLVAEAAGLAPGRALDVGCGEGGDSRWLAGRGWQVTAIDFAGVALERAAARAAELGLAAAITHGQLDITTADPDGGPFDLVSAQYFHLPPEPRRRVFTRLAGLVAPGGVLLVVGHDVSDLATSAGRPDQPELFFSGRDVADLLEPGGWQVLATDARPRPATDPDGHQITIADAVLVARRNRARPR
jgi:SAM-dependent methyltransferase